ncbi:sulfite exporter TauE/SafE family protein [Candidatus Microgenomates bacterium]|nr:sulfite exporter TauE/SafE family protein [Candidatus Microgenomates bacterium]
MNIVWLALITGLTTGGISCFAVQGGLLAGIMADQKKADQKKTLFLFLSSKTVSHFILGGLLGSLGSVLIITPKLQGTMQLFAGVFMLFVAAKLMDVHPFFKKFSFTPPKTFFKLVRISSKNESLFAPAMVGFLTFLIPCGITQAMMLLSVSTGNFLYGGLILAAYVVGTSPIFFALGLASEKVLSVKPLKFLAVGLIAFMGLFSINTGQILRGSNHTFQNYTKVMFESNNSKVLGASAKIGTNGVQEVTINAKNTSYESSASALKVGIPVKLTLKTNDTRGCSRAFTIPEYNISRVLPATGTETVEFTPTKTGRLTYACSMGMYTGSFNVVE